MSQATDPILLSVEDVAALLGVKTRTVWRLLAAKHIPSVQIGRLRRVRRDDLERYVDTLR